VETEVVSKISPLDLLERKQEGEQTVICTAKKDPNQTISKKLF